MSRPGELGVFLAVFRLTSEGFVGSNPTAPTFSNICRCVSAEVEESNKSKIYLACVGQEMCGAWMPRAKTTCARTPGHGGDCMTATNMANRREYNRLHGHRESPESRKKSNLVGHRGRATTETVYRKVIVPELRRGAEVMDRLFT